MSRLSAPIPEGSMLYNMRARRQSVSFKITPSGDLLTDSESDSADEIQIALAPNIQSYLTQTGERNSCCSVLLPIAFERADPKSWMNPKFDSPVLEGQYLASLFPYIRKQYRFSLSYILFCIIAWATYFSIGRHVGNDFNYKLPCIILVSASIIGLWFTYTDMYRPNYHRASVITSIILCSTGLSFLVFAGTAFSPLGHFALCLEIILLIYSAIPMILWTRAVIAISYTILFETLSCFVPGNIGVHGSNPLYYNKVLILRILLQFSVHLVALHVLIMNTVRMRGTFMKIGQNLLVRRQLEMEKQLKEKMIHSVMPPSVADMLLNEGGTEHADLEAKYMRPRSSSRIFQDVKSLFRPFHMHSMNNVSILFADIVGFTTMSSKKTAEQLVEILNDLFEKFDDLCTFNGCEKISTLGDCYYCVSGCPEPRPDHAICCVEMGLGMIDAMQSYELRRQEGVKMRVGVHTGTVLCGIVGTHRVKFDVWSNDVTFANIMESSGKPELVHISEATLNYLDDAYLVEEGEPVMGQRSYFVMGRNKETPHHNKNLNTSSNLLQAYNYEQSLSQNSIQPNNPPNSPVGQISSSCNPSPRLSNEKRRFLSVRMQVQDRSSNVSDTFTNNNSPLTNTNPTIIITTKSLPDGLDLEQECQCLEDSETTPTQITNQETEENKTKTKLKNWTLTGILKKIEDFRRSDASTDLINSAPSRPPPDESATKVEQNVYQQIPLLIETTNPTNTLNIPQRHGHPSPSTVIRSPDGSYSSDIIDIRSYISQSRSDISPFGRSGSYRSQNGRSGQQDCHCQDTPPEPEKRPRASTLAAATHDTAHNHQNTPPLPRTPCNHLQFDLFSICPSANSRKDSGIKSTSRRSSIQQQIFALNQSSAIPSHRVSGYFTSSTSSVNLSEAQYRVSSLIEPPKLDTPTQPVANPLAECLQQLRKQSDLLLIRCVRDNAKSQESNFLKPPLQRCTLFFQSEQMEREFRSKAHRFGIENENEGPPTLATPRYNTYIDIFVGIVVYFCVAASLFLMAPSTGNNFQTWLVIFSICTGSQFFALVFFTRQMCRRSKRKDESENTSFGSRIFAAISSWYQWHICLAILMAMPVVLVIIHYALLDLYFLHAFEYHYGFLIFVCIVHFCNFTQLNFWMRNVLALLAAIAFIIIAYNQMTDHKLKSEILIKLNQTISMNQTDPFRHLPMQKNLFEEVQWFDQYYFEIYLDLLLILVLVWLLNEDFEIGYRLTFYGNAVANQDKIRVQNMKNQADVLLHNIIPKHVAEHLKNTAKYSENHQNVAIIFASIVNFNEMYDESYLGGKEYLRVLNELIADFDEQLSRPEFHCVEKIKTIGSTFMAASGLDSLNRCVKNHHIYALMEFSKSMQLVVQSFNKDLLEFDLILRIGFNVGDVTAGVIGTSKLHYDIWGDAVNVASRMDTTGMPGRIQVGKNSLPYLQDKYEFESRGQIFVKGKGNMEAFLYKKDKPFSADNDCGNDCGLIY